MYFDIIVPHCVLSLNHLNAGIYSISSCIVNLDNTLNVNFPIIELDELMLSQSSLQRGNKLFGCTLWRKKLRK